MANHVEPEHHTEEGMVRFFPAKRPVRKTLAGITGSLGLFVVSVKLAIMSFRLGGTGLLPNLERLGLISTAVLAFGSLAFLIHSLRVGKRGLRVDQDGIVERVSWFPLGRVRWNEIFLALPLEDHSIELELRKAYFRRRSVLWRFGFWLNKDSAKSKTIRRPHLLPSCIIPCEVWGWNRDEVHGLLRQGIEQHRLRSTLEAKELEAGG
jgi:hypothetical protein